MGETLSVKRNVWRLRKALNGSLGQCLQCERPHLITNCCVFALLPDLGAPDDASVCVCTHAHVQLEVFVYKHQHFSPLGRVCTHSKP